MKEDKYIQELFGSALKEHESKVDPNLWSRIETGISGTPAATGAASSSASGAIGIGKIAIWIAGIAAIASVIYQLTTQDAKNDVAQVEKSVAQIESEKNKELFNEESPVVPGIEELDHDPNLSELKSDPSDSILLPSSNDHTISEEETFEKSEPHSEASAVEVVDISTTAQDEPSSSIPPSQVSSNPDNDSKKTVVEEVPVEFDASFTVIKDSDNPLLFHFNANESLDSYLWDFGDGLQAFTSQASHEFEEQGKYRVVLNAFKADEARESRVFVEAFTPIKIVIPNVFSPGGSFGMNDYFEIDHERSENIKVYKLLIYSAKGDLVFESSENRKRWDGSDRYGNVLPAGTYICVVRAEGPGNRIKEERKAITLKR